VEASERPAGGDSVGKAAASNLGEGKARAPEQDGAPLQRIRLARGRKPPHGRNPTSPSQSSFNLG